VGAPAASKVSMPPSDPTQMVNRQLVPAAGTYQIDPAHTFADFTAQHLVVGHVRGRFTQLAGQIIRKPVCRVIASISSVGRLRRLRRRGPAALAGGAGRRTQVTPVHRQRVPSVLELAGDGGFQQVIADAAGVTKGDISDQ
jgi:hypothetical protein